MEWLRLIPEADRPAFTADVLQRYRAAAPEGGENAFRFQQMEVALVKK